MGEIADMMLDGTLCEGCGVYLENSLGDFPQRCRDCRMTLGPSNTPAWNRFAPPRDTKKVACPTCGRHVKSVGLNDHQRDAHGVR